VARTLSGRAIVPGDVEGIVLRSERAISFWGGVDPATGRIIDRRHDRRGASIAGRVFVVPAEKGSSTGSAILLELIRAEVAPAAIVTREAAPILALGAIVAQELYGKTVPVVRVEPDAWSALVDDDRVRIRSDGSIQRIAG
jgi:predicted aconitase with swiveling domain